MRDAMKLEHLSKSFDNRVVLRDVCAELPATGLVCVTGPSGVGKTTLLRIVVGLEDADGGSVKGRPEHVSMLFEDDRLLPWLDVCGNITLAGAGRETAGDVLAELGLADRLYARIGELSAGQARRVALARALAFEAPVLVLDEPTARLDDESAALVTAAICKRAERALVLVATHDARLKAAASLCIELAADALHMVDADADVERRL